MKLEMDHILIRTANVDGMIGFFEKALALNNGSRPPFPFPGAWLWSDDRPLVHLSKADPIVERQWNYSGAGKKTLPQSGTGIIDHIAFSGADYPALIERLQHHRINYFETTVPSTAIRQVFIEGPEGLRVEIQFTSGH